MVNAIMASEVVKPAAIDVCAVSHDRGLAENVLLHDGK
jgi:hypothetical protein